MVFKWCLYDLLGLGVGGGVLHLKMGRGVPFYTQRYTATLHSAIYCHFRLCDILPFFGLGDILPFWTLRYTAILDLAIYCHFRLCNILPFWTRRYTIFDEILTHIYSHSHNCLQQYGNGNSVIISFANCVK